MENWLTWNASVAHAETELVTEGGEEDVGVNWRGSTGVVVTS